MSQDNPDTIIIEETARWESTQVEDVFLPSVRVQLAWADVEDAVASGAVVPAEAHSLWATWAMPGAPTRVANLARPSAFPGDRAPDGPAPAGIWGAATEISSGKDTPSGHWEMAGAPVTFDWGYFPHTIPAFPAWLTDAIIAEAKLPGILGNWPGWCWAAG